MRGAGILCLAAALSGCARYEARPISTGSGAFHLTHRTLADEEVRAAVVASGQRWPVGEWSLKSLTAVSWRLHPEVLVARAQYETARAGIRTAGERPNPTVNLSPQFTAPLKWMEGTYGLDFDITIETAGKRDARLTQAREQTAAAGFHVADVSWQVRGKLRKALLELSVASRKEALVQRAMESQNEVIGMMEQRVAVGDISRPDFVQSRLLLNQLRLQAADAARQNGEARATVAEAVGISAHALDGVRISLAEFEKIPALQGVGSARGEAMRHRADVLGALAEYAASEAALRGEVAKQYPDIHLAPGYQWDAGVNKWSLGSGFTLPIFNRNEGPIAEAEAKRREAAAKFSAAQSVAMAEVDRALASWNGARVKFTTTGEMMAAQEKQIQSAEVLAKSGESDRLAVGTARLEQATTAISQLDAQAELQAAFGAMEDALQTSLTK